VRNFGFVLSVDSSTSHKSLVFFAFIVVLLRFEWTRAGGQSFVKSMRNPTWLQARPAGRSLLFLSGRISGWFHA